MRYARVVSTDLAQLFDDLVRFETDLWNRVDARLRSEHDLSLAWFELMQVIDRTPDCRVLDIASALSITVGGTSKLVDRIEIGGLCRRQPNPTDRRSFVIELTGPGTEMLRAASMSFESELSAAFADAMPDQSLRRWADLTHTLRLHLHASAHPPIQRMA